MPYLLFAAGALGIHLAIAVFLLPGVLAGGLIETDGYLRLVRVERLLETGSWFDSTLPRVNAPYGETLHWTRPYDIWILLGSAPLLPFLADRTALHASGVASTPVLLVLACVLSAWAVRPLVPSRARLLAMPVLFSQAGVLMVSLPGRADHHTLIILVFVLALGALLRLPSSKTPTAGPVAGVALALGLWVSTEFLVIWLSVLAALALAWLAQGGVAVPNRARRLLVWTAGATGAFLLIERGFAGLGALEYDKISVAHLAVPVVGAVVWDGIRRLAQGSGSRLGLQRRVAVIALASALALGAIMLAFPGFLSGPWANLTPEQRRFWFDLIREFDPILPTSDDLGSFVAFIGPVLCGSAYTVVQLFRNRKESSSWAWLLLACLLALYLPLAVRNLRFTPLAQVPAAFALVAGLDALLGKLASLAPRMLAAALQATSAIVLLVGFLVLGGLLTPESATPSPTASAGCRLDRLAEFLARAEGLGGRQRIILAHWDYSPELLYRTPHAVVAATLHRNVQAVWEVRDVLGGSDESVSREVVERRDVDLILLCPAARGGYFAGGSGAPSLYARLVSGDVPAWLRRVPIATSGTEGFLLFEVVS